jgi:methyltransferase (TIGR00027 family)
MTSVSDASPKKPLPSITAYSVAVLRAQHQIVDGASIFKDPLAVCIVGGTDDSIAQEGHPALSFPRLRQFVAARSRFAEDTLAKAVARGVRQYVVLGAGFDTFGLRNPYADKGLRVFEVDRPLTQSWKRQCTEVANLTIPASLTLVPVNFERESFLDRLAAAGFKATEPVLFSWLGVVFYLTRNTVRSTLSTIAALPDAEIVFDYSLPLDAVPPRERVAYQGMMDRAAAAGEPWRSFFTPQDVKAGLTHLHFTDVEDLGPDEIGRRYFRKGRPMGARLVRARNRSPKVP